MHEGSGANKPQKESQGSSARLGEVFRRLGVCLSVGSLGGILRLNAAQNWHTPTVEDQDLLEFEGVLLRGKSEANSGVPTPRCPNCSQLGPRG